MTVLEHLTPEAVETVVRSHPRLSAAVAEIAGRTGLPEDVVRSHLTESLRESLERLGEAYVGHTTETITAIEGLRREIDAFYDRVLTGGDPNPSVEHLQDLFRQLHDKARDLSDPQTWANEQPATPVEPAHPPVEPVTPPVEPARAQDGPVDVADPTAEAPTLEPEPAAAAVERARAIETLRGHAREQVEAIEAEIRASDAASSATQQQIIDLNRELSRRGVDVALLRDPRYVERLSPELRALAERRADLIDENKARVLDRRQLGERAATWRRAVGSDLVARRYLELRRRTPDRAARQRSAAVAADILGVPNTELNPTRPDHIVPVLEVVGMDNFVLLPDDVALGILNDPAYIDHLNESANSSKSDWAWDDWPQWQNHGVDPILRADRIARSAEIRAEIRQRIQTAVSRLVGSGNLPPVVTP
ncbi:hypothetical protein [Cellulomonas alba]|uniref:Uncharacterized protein n=1 Tax=Cellulomonas alba TaxID=3053467 RepID=A0ABT7SI52_9CELL|nr:hypothetical protein [Cellulomonas alba]MDM7855868.1 hypothetical protein [Cellulomonas alba]